MDLTTSYLGLELPHPFIVGASPIARSVDGARRAEDGGAAAIVLHSLFEEQFARHEVGLQAHVHSHEETFAEATSYFTASVGYHYGPEQYLEHVAKLKQRLSIPVIASLNGTHEGGWMDYARYLAEAGADALELNLYHQPRPTEEPAAAIEADLLNIITAAPGTISTKVN